MEPDGRSPASQPAAVSLALRTLHEADAWDDDLAAGACDWLERTAPAAGGATFVDPSIDGWPHAPWWVPQEGLPPSLITTGGIAGPLLARGVRHPWLERATELLWSRIERLKTAGAYDMLGVLSFLEHAPDRRRAEPAFERAGRRLRERRLVELDPDAPGEVHGPLQFAPYPGSTARRFFDGATIAAHLDRLARGQQEDGGWTFNWADWSPLATLEWRGVVTVDALVVLRANGRLDGAG
jgi:hypothetical protein